MFRTHTPRWLFLTSNNLSLWLNFKRFPSWIPSEGINLLSARNRSSRTSFILMAATEKCTIYKISAHGTKIIIATYPLSPIMLFQHFLYRKVTKLAFITNSPFLICCTQWNFGIGISICLLWRKNCRLFLPCLVIGDNLLKFRYRVVGIWAIKAILKI